MQDIQSFRMTEPDPKIEAMPLGELVACPLENIEREGCSILWFIKMIESTILNSFMVETVKDYRTLFQNIEGLHRRESAIVFQVQPSKDKQNPGDQERSIQFFGDLI